MTPQIRPGPLTATLLGASSPHDPARSYGQEIRLLLDQVWPVLKKSSVPNKGLNWVVYDGCARVFAGVEVEGMGAAPAALERRVLEIGRHGWIKHTGPYQGLGRAYGALETLITAQGLRGGQPRIEVYGHWTSDESMLETELVIPVS